MVLTRSQIENLTREELIEELLQLSDISYHLKALNHRFDTFAAKHEELKSALLITKNYNNLLHQRIIQLERNAVNLTGDTGDIGENVLEVTVYRDISLTGHEITLMAYTSFID